MSELEQLKAENEKLRSMNEAKSDLISISAHQLRTSLTALKWILKIFTDKDLGKLSLEQEGLLEKAVESNERMVTLVNDLLTLTHADDPSIKFKFEKISIKDLVDHSMSQFKGETSKKGIGLNLEDVSVGLPDVECDREMISVVLQNLIENSIKYSDNGDTVSINLSASKDTLDIKVHDTGIGIDQADQASIFNKFFRASNAIEKDRIGSGLGLFTTKNIIDRHKGKIWFESSKDKGTTFFVSLPISQSV